ncbi:MAG: hypothetical protein NZL88_03130, partial [Gaiellaceae bacterium]|nr:hypothetical protein [Gaiellaceae bacterium]
MLHAHARAALVLVSALDLPRGARALRCALPAPRLEERLLAGVPTTVAIPISEGACPTLVFLNGATPLGRHHPAVRRLAVGLARAGLVAYLPDVHGLAHGEITERTVAD